MIKLILATYLVFTVTLNFITWNLFGFQVGFVTFFGIYRLRLNLKGLHKKGVSKVSVGDLKITYNPLKLLYLVVGYDTLTIQLDNVSVYLSSTVARNYASKAGNTHSQKTSNSNAPREKPNIQELFDSKSLEIFEKIHAYSGLLFPFNFQVNNLKVYQDNEEIFTGDKIRIIGETKKNDQCESPSTTVSVVVNMEEFIFLDQKVLGRMLFTSSFEFIKNSRMISLFFDYYSKDIDFDINKLKTACGRFLNKSTGDQPIKTKEKDTHNVSLESLYTIDEKLSILSFLIDRITLRDISVVLENVNVVFGNVSYSANRYSTTIQSLYNNVPIDNSSKLEVLIALTSLNIRSIHEKQLFTYLPFANVSTYFDVNKLLEIILHRHDTEKLEVLLNDQDLIMKSLVAINFSNINIPLARLLEILNERRAKALITKPNSELFETNGAVDGETAPGKSTLFFKLLHKIVFKFHFSKFNLSLKFSDTFSMAMKIDEIEFEYKDARNVNETLFTHAPKLMHHLIMLLNVRNLSIISSIMLDNHKHKRKSEFLKIDKFVSWMNINSSDLVVNSIDANVNSIEVLFSRILVFKQLSKAIDRLRLTDFFKGNGTKSKKNVSSGNIGEYKPFLPYVLQKMKFSINQIKLIAAFQNQINTYNNQDESEFNKYFRGISAAIRNLSIDLNNLPNSQKLKFNLSSVEVFKVRELDVSKFRFSKRLYSPFLDLHDLSVSYYKSKNKLLVDIPIIEAGLSIEIVWLLLFVKSVIGSISFSSTKKGSPVVEEVVENETESDLEVKPKLKYNLSIGLFMFRLDLPHDVPLILELDSLKVVPVSDSPRVSFRVLRLYGVNPFQSEFWSPIIIFISGKVAMDSKSIDGPQVDVSFESMRLEVPFEYVFYSAFDNLLTFCKTAIQLGINMKHIMQFDTLPKDFKNTIKMPSVVHPVKIPKIQIKAKQFQFCMHDDPFETELNDILLFSMVEKKIRSAKLAAFECAKGRMMNDLFAKYPNVEVVDGVPVRSSNTGFAPAHSNDSSVIFESSLEPSLSNSAVPSPTTTSRRPNTLSTKDLNNPHKFGRRRTTRNAYSSSLSKETFNRSQQDYDNLVNELNQLEAKMEISKKRLYSNMSKSWITKVRRQREKRRAAALDSEYRACGPDPLIRKEFMDKYPVLISETPSSLFSFELVDMIWNLDEPDFGVQNYAEYLHTVGKGIPKTMQYTILVPLLFDIYASRLSVQIKDYPLPLVSFGGHKEDTSESVNLRGNFVVAEQLYGPHELRWIFVPCANLENDPVVPGESMYSCNIPRTLTTIKFYTDLQINVVSKRRGVVSWSTSIQPGLGYAMNSFDILSKPPLDKSPLIGFWDKFALSLHGAFNFRFENGLDLFIKSGSSPYLLMAKNAGYAFRWSENVNLKINSTGKSQDLLIVESNVFDIIIPKFGTLTYDKFLRLTPSHQITYTVLKKVLKLNGKPVRWKLGFFFEKNADEGDDNLVIGKHSYKPGQVERTSKFKDHWEIELRNPSTFENPEDALSWDSYKGYRSRYLHLAVSLEAAGNYYGDGMFNSLHFTPLATHHFFSWWHSFNSLGLPIKQGSMFKNKFLDYRQSPRFGDTLYTIKYQLLLKSLFITHCYLHSGANSLDPSNKVTYTGMKCFVKGFSLDLHQVSQEMVLIDKNTNKPYSDWKLKMTQGEVDFEEADLRVLAAEFNQTCVGGMLAKALGLQSQSSSSNVSSNGNVGTDTSSGAASSDLGAGGTGTGTSTSNNNMSSWLDLDDFVEIEANNMSSEIPRWSAIKLASSPRFSYFRQTPESTVIPYPFGSEDSHSCSIGTNHPEKTQEKLASERVAYIADQMESLEVTLTSLKDNKSSSDPLIAKKIDELEYQLVCLERKRHLVSLLKAELTQGYADPEMIAKDIMDNKSIASEEFLSRFDSKLTTSISNPTSLSRMTTNQSSDILDTSNPHSTSPYRNRFIIHNIFFTWNNQLRSKVLRYLDNMKVRRSSTFNLSRRAVKLAEDLLNSKVSEVKGVDLDSSIVDNYEFERSSEAVENMDDILKDLAGYIDAIVDDTYLLKFISPQVRLFSKKDPNSCLLIASRDITMKTVSINSTKNDDGIVADGGDEENTMATRTGVVFNNAFVYVLEREQIMKHAYGLFYFSEEENWPPKLPIEMCYNSDDLEAATVVNGTSIALLSVIRNKLYFAENSENANSNSDDSLERKIGSAFKAMFPKIVVTTNSKQYLTVLNVITDVIEFDDTLELKKVEDKMQKLISISDDQDYSEIPSLITRLQEGIRSLTDSKHHMFLLEAAGHSDNCELSQEYDQINMEIEKLGLQLHYMVDLVRKAKSSKFSELYEVSKSTLTTDEVLLHLIDDDNKPFVDVTAKDAYYMTVKSSEGSSLNKVSIQLTQAFDLHDGCKYPEILSPLLINKQHKSHNEDLVEELCKNPTPMAVVDWKLLPPIGGIEIVEHKVITFSPIKVEVDYLTAKKLFEFLYPKDAIAKHDGKDGTDSSAMDEEDSFNFFYGDDESVSIESSSIMATDDDDDSSLSTSSSHHPKFLSRFLSTSKPAATSSGHGHSHSTSSLEDLKTSSVPLPVSRKDSPNSSNSSLFSPNRRVTSGSSNGSGSGSGGTHNSTITPGSLISTTTSSNSVEKIHLGRKDSSSKRSEKKPAGDINEILKRSEAYSLLNKVVINPIKLSISFKGQGALKIVNIERLIVDVPKLEYANKTWSNEDFLLHFRKDILRIALRHTGKFIGNKMVKHKNKSRLSQPLSKLIDYNGYTKVSDLTKANTNLNTTPRRIVKSEKPVPLSPPKANNYDIPVIKEDVIDTIDAAVDNKGEDQNVNSLNPENIGSDLLPHEEHLHHHHHHHHHGPVYDPDLLEPESPSSPPRTNSHEHEREISHVVSHNMDFMPLSQISEEPSS